ncbi:efflux RND transporter periplasmic adaptor subunit [Labilibaculum sp. DW002]|uniref:Efflux RND transporter periplasmic adaptor subunit n=1 Tax=Paralabilibaculum antarcticum TaxID=2912572 RepID=A0ABT5VW75_9BACT|nr:efflux RND transporter periplasmic adaptor subunit [Labilibaculum sp. DW002]MDE5419660.1 efflux RND transporter periplasmic adaptor subunit [Labilibaculum sp. DW002]
MKSYILLANILLTMCFFACKPKTPPINPIINESEQLIQISKQQFITEKMEIGRATTHCFEDLISCNGSISAPPNGIANISTPISGIVKSIHFTTGDYVKKGQVLCQIESNELISLQQDFAEISAHIPSIKAAYERNKALYNEKIGAKKNLNSSESTYKSAKAKYESLELKLKILHLDTNKIKEGDFYSSLSLTAPIDGFITNYNMILGEFAEQQKSLLEIVNTNLLQVQISVFEKDIQRLKIGQIVHFKTLSNSDKIHTAHISAIGKGIDPKTKTILCLAKIEEEAKGKLYNGSFIEAEIITNEKDAKALPSQAILKSGPDRYVFVIDKSDGQNYYLRKEKIKTGSESKGFTEIVGSQNLAKILTKGAYNISLN